MARGPVFACPDNPVPGLIHHPAKDVDTMQSTHLLTWDPRVPALEGARTRGIFTEFYDPARLPSRPAHLPLPLGSRGPADPIRQLRAKNLRPGGQEPVAQIMWRYKGRRKNKRCVAYLYRIDLGPAQAHRHPRPVGGHRQSTGGPAAPAPPAARARTTTSPVPWANATTARPGATNDAPRRWP